jgi:hypothetical protein
MAFHGDDQFHIHMHFIQLTSSQEKYFDCRLDVDAVLGTTGI